MDAAVTALTPANEAALLASTTPDGPVLAQGPLGRLQALPARKKTLLGMGLAGLLALVVVLLLWSRHVPMAPLFAQALPDNDAGAVIDTLSKLGEPWQISAVGNLILVPAERTFELRTLLAQKGLPKVAPSGFELMNKQSFGQSQQQERTNLALALGSQLEKQIGTLSAVQSARVIVALTQQNGYYREQEKPTASVLLTLHPGLTLDRKQIAGIVHMTAMAVPGLSPKNVSISDQDSNWLTSPDNETNSDLTQQQRSQQRETEARLIKNVKELLEPALGADNLRVKVNAELDFNQVESTSEAYAPNQGVDKSSVRSQSTLEAAGTGNSAPPTGVPGAASNQVPAAASAPIVGAASPLQAAQSGLGGVGGGAGARRESKINYEVDKTVEVKRSAVGNVKRLNVAVLVNHRTSTDAKGKQSTTALPPEEIEKLTALAQEAVGFKKERGDSVRVESLVFRAVPKVDDTPAPLYKQPWLIDLLKAAGVPAALTGMALMLLFGVIRPALRPDTPPAPPIPPAGLNAVVDDPEPLPGDEAATLLALEGPKAEKQLMDARQMAMDNPLAVANLMRNWMQGEDA